MRQRDIYCEQGARRIEISNTTVLITILVLGVVAIILVASIWLFVYVSRAARGPKIKNAILGQATVLKIWETGLKVNNRLQVGI